METYGGAEEVIYYNENDPDAADWIQALIDAGEIGWGIVDRRSICDVQPHELNGFVQYHFFAGISGWPLALRIAGWPDGRPVCTGSCPCQPFSQTGLRLGVADPRHLWPQFFRLIRVRGFPEIFGEQVAGEDGEIWFSGVRADLEGQGYEVGASDLPAASVGAPQKRQRLYWVAYANRDRRNQQRRDARIAHETQGTASWIKSSFRREADGLGYSYHEGPQGRRLNRDSRYQRSPWAAGVGVLGSDKKKRRRVEPSISPVAYGVPDRVALIRGSGNAICPDLAAEFILASEEACP